MRFLKALTNFGNDELSLAYVASLTLSTWLGSGEMLWRSQTGLIKLRNIAHIEKVSSQVSSRTRTATFRASMEVDPSCISRRMSDNWQQMLLTAADMGKFAPCPASEVIDAAVSPYDFFM